MNRKYLNSSKKHGAKSLVAGAVFWLAMQCLIILLINLLSSQLPDPIDAAVEALLLPAAYIAFFLFVWRLSDSVKDANKLRLIRRIIIIIFFLMSIGLVLNMLITFVTLQP